MKYGKVQKTAGRLQSVEIYEGETIEQKARFNNRLYGLQFIVDYINFDW